MRSVDRHSYEAGTKKSKREIRGMLPAPRVVENDQTPWFHGKNSNSSRFLISSASKYQTVWDSWKF